MQKSSAAHVSLILQPGRSERGLSPAPSDCTVPPDFLRPVDPVRKIDPRSPVKEDSPDLRFLRTDRIICPASCICKHRGRHTKYRSPAVEVISHKIKDGICFLLSVLESPKSAPTYLRQCEVPKEVRLEYYNYFRQNGRPKPFDVYWNAEKEREMRDAMFSPLPRKEQCVQEEIGTYLDTTEWAKKTKNKGRFATFLPITVPAAEEESETSESVESSQLGSTESLNSEYSGPALTLDSTDSRVMERIIGVTRMKNKLGKRDTWFLIKWEGWDVGQSSWEPAQPEGTSTDAERAGLFLRLIRQFTKAYGKPTAKRKKILSPEGEEYEQSRHGPRGGGGEVALSADVNMDEW